MSWSIDDIPDLSGRRAVVTGVTGGIGYHVALELARAGATVLATARDPNRGAQSVEAIRREVPDADVSVEQLDLASLASVRAAANKLAAGTPIHLLVNNAGVMAPPERTTLDGFELQIGTNHLGPFALTGLVWSALVDGAARVVTVSSLMHRTVRGIDLRSVAPMGVTPFRPYRRWVSYSESKLANLLFTQELDRRAREVSSPVTVVAAHPGYASTRLQASGPEMDGRSVQSMSLRIVTKLAGQSAAAGARPVLMAATMAGLAGGSYVGPSGLGEWRGSPRLVGMSRTARDHGLAAALWAASQAATRVPFP